MLFIWMTVLASSSHIMKYQTLDSLGSNPNALLDFSRSLPCEAYLLTLVTTARIAIPCMMGCHAPMSWAFSGTMRLYWVVSFHASTLISNILFTRANRGASGKEATNKVTNPNWITVNGMDIHHGVVDGWKDNTYSFTLIKKEKGKQWTTSQREKTFVVIIMFNSERIQTKDKYKTSGEKTHDSLFLSHIYTS